MKRLILFPKTDTITICLPPDWVGQTVTCSLRHTEHEMATPIPLAAERALTYHVKKKKKKTKSKIKKTRKKTKTSANQPLLNA
ncbi:MAG: hypothetical protein MJZ52_03365 [Bacteroidales bacterium]|nr:hypothetical protein [Bacteroidales bacterium]